MIIPVDAVTYLVEEAGAMREAAVDDGAEAAGAARRLVVGQRRRRRRVIPAAAQVRGCVRAANVAHHLHNQLILAFIKTIVMDKMSLKYIVFLSLFMSL